MHLNKRTQKKIMTKVDVAMRENSITQDLIKIRSLDQIAAPEITYYKKGSRDLPLKKLKIIIDTLRNIVNDMWGAGDWEKTYKGGFFDATDAEPDLQKRLAIISQVASPEQCARAIGLIAEMIKKEREK